MDRKKAVLLGILVVFAGLVAALALRNPQPPLIPPDAVHTAARSVEECLACHDTGGTAPRDANHPVGHDCSRCHGWER